MSFALEQASLSAHAYATANNFTNSYLQPTTAVASSPVAELQLAADRVALKKAQQATHNSSVRLHFRHLSVDTLGECLTLQVPSPPLSLSPPLPLSRGHTRHDSALC